MALAFGELSENRRAGSRGCSFSQTAGGLSNQNRVQGLL